jgi:hypothetical protein
MSALGTLGEPVLDRTPILNVLRGLNDRYSHLVALITRTHPLPSFSDVRADLLNKEVTMASKVSIPTTLVASSSPSCQLVLALVEPQVLQVATLASQHWLGGGQVLALTVSVVLAATAKVMAILDIAGATTPQVMHRGPGSPNIGTLSPVLSLFGQDNMVPALIHPLRHCLLVLRHLSQAPQFNSSSTLVPHSSRIFLEGSRAFNLYHFIGMSVSQTPSGMFLSQRHYMLEILERTGMTDCNPCSTLIDTNAKLSVDGPPIADATNYLALARALWFLTFTHPDICYVVQQISLYMHDPREPHLALIKCVLRYIKGTLDYGLKIVRSSTSNLIAYSDADWAGCPDTRRSTSGM